jgi:hypothetical protein
MFDALSGIAVGAPMGRQGVEMLDAILVAARIAFFAITIVCVMVCDRP